MIGLMYVFAHVLIKIQKYGLIFFSFIMFILIYKFSFSTMISIPHNRHILFIVIPSLFLLDFILPRINKYRITIYNAIFEKFYILLNKVMDIFFNPVDRINSFVLYISESIEVILGFVSFFSLFYFTIVFFYIDGLNWKKWISRPVGVEITYGIFPMVLLIEILLPVFTIILSRILCALSDNLFRRT